MGMINGALSLLCAIFALLLIGTVLLSPSLRRRSSSGPALLMMVFVFISLILDAISFLFFDGNRELFNILITVSNISAFFTEWFFCLFIISKVHVSLALKRSITAILGVLCLIGSALYIVNSVRPIFFDFRRFEYLPASGYWSYSILNYLFFVGSSVLLLFKAGNIALRDKIIPLSTMAFPLTSLIWDTTVPGLYSWDILVFMAAATNYVHLMFLLVESAEQKIEKLEMKRIRATLERIKPHYIYNVLASIYYLCDQDVGTAKEAIHIFSDYLRDVLNMMEVETLIPLSRELRTVRNYLELEQMRFGDHIRVRYQIDVDDFELPPFTLQPLVENSVKHGVEHSEKDGEILIASFERGDNYIVAVRDTFEGFDSEGNEAGGGAGTKYVRDILSMTVDGTLQIKSKPGEGTISMIILPKK